MKPIEKISVTEKVISELKTVITSGEYQADDKFPTENEISTQLGVGRSSVREALRYLQALGLLEVKPGKGFFVTGTEPMDSNDTRRWFRNNELDVQDVLEVRRAIEPAAARLAALRRTAAEMEQLRQIDQQFQKAMNLRNTSMLVKADEAFHTAIFKAGGNKLFIKFNRSLTDHNERYRIKCYSFEETIEHSVDAHRQILQALDRQDPAAAEYAMSRHLESVRGDLDDTTKDVSPNVGNRAVSPEKEKTRSKV